MNTPRAAIVSVIAAGLLLVGGCAKTKITDSATTLTFVYDGQADWTTQPDARGLSAITATDARPQDARDGLRVAEKDLSRAAIALNGDIEAWLEQGVSEILTSTGLEVDQAGAPTLSVRLEELYLREDIYVQAEYDSRVRITLEMKDNDGRVIWSRSAIGERKNYGKPASDENYAETLSSALYRAIKSAVNTAEFERAIAGE